MLLQFIRLIIFYSFMHMEGKIGSEICSCFTSILIMYLLIHSLTEGNYIYEVLKLRRLSGIFNNILIHNMRFAFIFCTLNSILSIMKKI
jgi:hypothetical protein